MSAVDYGTAFAPASRRSTHSVRRVTSRDRRLCEYPSQVVRLRQFVSGPQELELLYPKGC